jgi:predicted dehydrogenase
MSNADLSIWNDLEANKGHLPHLVIVWFGAVMSLKYVKFLKSYKDKWLIDWYTIVDLDTKKESVEKQIKRLVFKPDFAFFLSSANMWENLTGTDDFWTHIAELKREKRNIKVYIATEAKSHEWYLDFCIRNCIDSLVEKPIITPMNGWIFCPEEIEPRMKRLIDLWEKTQANHSVMSLSRYHRVYNDHIKAKVEEVLTKFDAPITSFHLRTSSWVWNTPEELSTREDHPYKYGYGMLMHGAYHYIDIAAQFLELNRKLFPGKKLSITLSSFSAHPFDQNVRVSKKVNELIWISEEETKEYDSLWWYWETDTTTTFCLKDEETGKVITLWTLCFEQTTPCFRNWKKLPEGIYNKNGRLPSTDIEIQLSTIFWIHGKLFKVYKKDSSDDIDILNGAQVTERSNINLIWWKKPYNFTEYSRFETTSKDELIESWLNGVENRSKLRGHLLGMILLWKIAQSIRNPGYPITFNLD